MSFSFEDIHKPKPHAHEDQTCAFCHLYDNIEFETIVSCGEKIGL